MLNNFDGMITKVDDEYYIISDEFFEKNKKWIGDKEVLYVHEFFYDEEIEYWFSAQFYREDKNLYYLEELF